MPFSEAQKLYYLCRRSLSPVFSSPITLRKRLILMATILCFLRLRVFKEEGEDAC